MLLLVLAGLAWIALHLGIAGSPLRAAIVQRVGERAFRAGFSILSVVVLVWLILAYRAAPTEPVWIAPGWLGIVLALLMLPAFALFVGAISIRNPTAVGGEAAIAASPTGILRITRHPMLWAFSIWAAVHVIGNGDTAGIAFFGSFLVTAVAGMPSIDAKLARREPAAWCALAGATSIVPFAAIGQRRNYFRPQEYGWWRFAAAFAVWGALLHWHPTLFGANPLSG